MSVLSCRKQVQSLGIPTYVYPLVCPSWQTKAFLYPLSSVTTKVALMNKRNCFYHDAQSRCGTPTTGHWKVSNKKGVQKGIIKKFMEDRCTDMHLTWRYICRENPQTTMEVGDMHYKNICPVSCMDFLNMCLWPLLETKYFCRWTSGLIKYLSVLQI